MFGEPARRVQNELDAYQCHLAIGGLVDERLGLRGFEGEIPEQGTVDVMYAHGSVVGPGNAAQKWSVAGGGGVVDVDVLARALANQLHQLGRGRI